MAVQNFIAAILGLAAFIAALVLGKSFLIPLAIAIMLWYIIEAISGYIAQLKIKQYRPFRSSHRLLALLLIALVLSGLIVLVGDTVEEVGNSTDKYQDNVEKILLRFSQTTGVEIAPVIQHWVSNNLNLGAIIGGLAAGIMNLASDTGLVLIYLAFFMLEQRYFLRKLRLILHDKQKRRNTLIILSRIQQQIRRYLYIKTLVSVLTAVLSYLVLITVGVDYASFWALIIFMLNYIPVIGSFVAVLLPTALSLVQFETITPFLTLLFTLGSLQIIIGNILEPKLMGSSLNLSPLVVILALSLWGQLWGITGMFLSVPLTVIAMIIMANFPSTRPIAIAMSENGKLSI